MTWWNGRLRAVTIHLAISLLVGTLAAALVFALWYPYPYREISGGRELFFLVASVDVILGPLLTLVIFNPQKPFKVLARDLAVVAAFQLTALGYGLWTVFVARPVSLVFEIDRFRVVHAIDVPDEMLSKAPDGLNQLPLFSRSLLAVRPFSSREEGINATLAALNGMNLAFRPDFWQPYADAASRVRQAAKPAPDLLRRFPQQAKEINEAVAKTGHPIDQLMSLPVVSRKLFWTALLDKNTLDIVGFIPLDSF